MQIRTGAVVACPIRLAAFGQSTGIKFSGEMQFIEATPSLDLQHVLLGLIF